MKMIKIYVLRHPISKEIRYIGYTKTSLEDRLKLHLRKAKVKNNYRSNWIKSLPSAPIIEEIDEGLYEDRNWMEQMYISLFLSWGFRLVNGTIGGDGGDTFSNLSDESKVQFRKKCALAGRKGAQITLSNPDNLKKFSSNMKEYNKVKSGEIKHPSLGFKHSKISRHKMSKAKLGKISNRKGVSNYGKIAQLDFEGRIIRIFENPAIAGDHIGQNNTNIIRAALGKQKTAYGFMWQFM